jgi:uncharacterized protein YbaR (Trm112 family)
MNPIPLVIVILLVGVVVMCAISTVRMLNRRDQLTCPDCHGRLVALRLSPFRRWKSQLGFEGGLANKPGFTLRCEHCSVVYRFSPDCRLVGRVEGSDR